MTERRLFQRNHISQMQPNSILAIAPSFNSYSSAQFAEIAAKVIREIRIEEEEMERDNAKTSDFVPETDLDEPPQKQEENDGAGNEAVDDDDDFEFNIVCQDPDASTISADEIFSNGQIRPLYPIFNRDLIVEHGEDDEAKSLSTSVRLPLRKLLIDGRDPSSASPSPSTSSAPESDSPNTIPNETFCIWTPKSTPPATPDRCKKSNSTGSTKRWRFRDLLHRSSSDGKNTFVFLSTSAIKRGEKTEEPLKEKSNSSFSAGKGKTVSAHELHYVRNRKMREGDRHRSYLPYRQDLVGFFANVNGLSRSFHPI